MRTRLYFFLAVLFLGIAAHGQAPYKVDISGNAGSTVTLTNSVLGNTADSLSCDGDSIVRGNTLATPSTMNYCYLAQSLPALSGKVAFYQNIAVDGSDDTSVSGHYVASVKPKCQAVGTTFQRSFYVVATGTNDLGGTLSNPAEAYSAAATYALLNSIWTTAHADGCTVIATTIMQRQMSGFPLTSWIGIASIAGSTLTWISGQNFTGMTAGVFVAIAGTTYTVSSLTDSTHVVLTTAPGNNSGIAFAAGEEAQRVLLNDLIRSSTGYDYLLDMDQVLKNNASTSTFSGDGLHLSAAGHIFAARYLNQVLILGGSPGTSTGSMPMQYLDTTATLAGNDNFHVPSDSAVLAYLAAHSAGARLFNPIVTLGSPISSSTTVLAYAVPSSPTVTITIPANCAGSLFTDIATATASTTFIVKKNGTTFCTGTVAAAGSTITWSTGGSTNTFVSADVITVVYSGDLTLTGGLTLAGSY